MHGAAQMQVVAAAAYRVPDKMDTQGNGYKVRKAYKATAKGRAREHARQSPKGKGRKRAGRCT